MAVNRAPQKTNYDPAALAAELASRHVADIVDILNETPVAIASQIIAHLPIERVADILDEPELNAVGELIQSLPAQHASVLLQAMSADRAAEVLRSSEEPARSRLLSLLDPETKTSLQRLLAYPPDTAGSLMTTEFVSVPANWTVESTLEHIRNVERTRETVYAIYILDPATNALVQTASLRRLIAGEPTASICSVSPNLKPITVSPLMDREEVGRLITKYDLLAVPVLDDGGLILGIVTVDDIIDALIEENTEDAQKFGGMQALNRRYTEIGFLEMVRKRGGWLAILFLGEMLTASAMQYYESELAKAVVLTLFIPLVMSSGGNSGSQATSLIIRALALQELRLANWWRVALGELRIGVALGALLGTIGMARIAIWQLAGLYDYGEHWRLVALTIGVALVCIVTFGSLAGSMLPFILNAIRLDPATASAPFVATLVDVTGIVIYFSIALLILTGTLL